MKKMILTIVGLVILATGIVGVYAYLRPSAKDLAEAKEEFSWLKSQSDEGQLNSASDLLWRCSEFEKELKKHHISWYNLGPEATEEIFFIKKMAHRNKARQIINSMLHGELSDREELWSHIHQGGGFPICSTELTKDGVMGMKNTTLERMWKKEKLSYTVDIWNKATSCKMDITEMGISEETFNQMLWKEYLRNWAAKRWQAVLKPEWPSERNITHYETIKAIEKALTESGSSWNEISTPEEVRSYNLAQASKWVCWLKKNSGMPWTFINIEEYDISTVLSSGQNPFTLVKMHLAAAHATFEDVGTTQGEFDQLMREQYTQKAGRQLECIKITLQDKQCEERLPYDGECNSLFHCCVCNDQGQISEQAWQNLNDYLTEAQIQLKDINSTEEEISKLKTIKL